MIKKTITVFGSSIPKPGDDEYQLAYELGRQLAVAGFDVCSGGYSGIMEAVSKGAVEKGAEAYGVTVNIGWASKPNRYITNEINKQTLFERIDELLGIADGYVILNGGTGTLVELSIVWEYLNKNLMQQKPAVCVGEMWDGLLTIVDERMKFENRQTNLIAKINSPKEVCEYLLERTYYK